MRRFNLSAKTMLHIEQGAIFFCVIPKDGLDETKGEDQLRYALFLSKPILLWYPTGRCHLPVPRVLQDKIYWMVCGTPEAAHIKARELMRKVSGTDKGWTYTENEGW